MGRRLADATKAWRARRTRGETVLRRLCGPAFFGEVFLAVFAELFAAPTDDFAGFLAEVSLLEELACGAEV